MIKLRMRPHGEVHVSTGRDDGLAALEYFTSAVSSKVLWRIPSVSGTFNETEG